jgi:starvation-inducible outer membrane lipoprotein
MARSSRSLALALVAGSLALTLGGCTQVEESVSTYSPTSVKPLDGQDDIKQVTFTAQAAQRAGLRTAAVHAGGGRTSIPYAALIYDEEGKTYTYVSRTPLVYVRTRIRVDHIAGGRVVLRRGPPAGTRVVTTGAAEVYSAEFGVEE